MNLWYTVSNVVRRDELGDEDEEKVYEFEQFETKEQAQKHIPRIRGRFKAKPIIATVEWTPEFWKKFYAERKTYDSVKVESKYLRKIYY